MPRVREEQTRLLQAAADPLFFVRHVLGADPWAVPVAIMRALAVPRARVAVKGCHASGKSWTAARVVLWWVGTGGIALTTAPSGTQVRLGLWAEVHRAYEEARVPLGGTLLQKEWRIAADCYAMGLSTNMGVRFQGFHGRLLVVLDEAPGVLQDIWPAISGMRAGGDVRILALGNPVLASGAFYDAFTTQRAAWQTFTIDAFATPNLQGVTVDDLRRMTPDELDDNPRPYLVTRSWVKEKLDEGGEDSPDWQSRVRGQFPSQSPDALISLAWLEAAARREPGEVSQEGLWAGLDVAGPGESETALVVRRGGLIVPGFPRCWTEADPRGAVVAALSPFKAERITVNVDSIGQGHYMARHLQDAGYHVRDINVGEAPSDREKFANLKAELYWGLRLRFQQGDMAGLVDEKAISQLAGIRYQHTPRGQVQIESKEAARKRGVASPDRAESVMLAFAMPPRGKQWRSAAAGERPAVAAYRPR